MNNFLGYGIKANDLEDDICLEKVIGQLKLFEDDWVKDFEEDFKNGIVTTVDDMLYGDPYDNLANLLYNIICAQNPDLENIFDYNDDNMGTSWLCVMPVLPWNADNTNITEENAENAFIKLIKSVTETDDSDEEIVEKYSIGKQFVYLDD